jgi:hypothetical protein
MSGRRASKATIRTRLAISVTNQSPIACRQPIAAGATPSRRLSRLTTTTYDNGAQTTHAYELDDDLSQVAQSYGAGSVSFDYLDNLVNQRTDASVSDNAYLWQPAQAASNSYLPNELNQYDDVAKPPAECLVEPASPNAAGRIRLVMTLLVWPRDSRPDPAERGAARSSAESPG